MNITLDQLTQPVVLAAVALLFALYFFISSGIMVFAAKRRAERFEKASGTVSAVEVTERFRSADCIPTVRYTVDGREYTVIPRGRIPNVVYKEGDVVELRYDKDAPSTPYIDDRARIRYAAGIRAGVGVVCVIMAAVLVAKQLKG